MKKLNNKITKIFLSFFIVFFILTNSFLTTKADVISSIDVDSYTDSDEFEYDSNTYNINQYQSELYNRYGGFILKGAAHTPEWVKKGEDDPIVKIIPKEYFSLEGNHSYIGQEYGFFITTEKVEMYNDDYGGLYNSTVFVFDVKTEMPSKTSQIIVTVKPIFQYEYITMIERGSFKINNVELGFGIIDEVLEEAWVIAKPTSIDIFTYEVKYGMCDKYALKDIAFEANLANEQNLNAFDDGYNAYDDYGYFFTGFDYGFYGHTIEYVQTEEKSYLKELLDHLSFFVGFLDNKIIDKIDHIYEGISLISDDICLLTSESTVLGIKLGTKEKEITTVEFPQNRDEQISKCKEKLHKERLIKRVVLKPNEKDTDTYYGINEYFIAKFNVNHSALGSMEKEYTRFTNNLFVKIVNSKNKEEIAIAQGSLTNYIGEKQEKEIKIYQDNNIFLLPDGENSFIFTPLYSGYYNININLDENVLVLIDNEEYSGSNIKIKKYIEKNKTINIKIYKNYSRLVGKINVNLDNENNNYTLNPNCELLIPFNSKNDMLKITSNNPNVLIDSIYYLNYKNELIKINSIDPDYIVTYHFNEHDKYLILLKNISSESQRILFETKEIDSLVEGINSNINLYKNYTYFKIDNLGNGQYLVITDVNEIYNFTILNSKFNPLSNSNTSKIEENIISVDGDKIYYLGFTSFNYSVTNITIKSLDESYEWEIKGDNDFYLKTHESDIRLKRGHNYIINFLINGQICESKISAKKEVNRFSFFNNTQTLHINDDCGLNNSIELSVTIKNKNIEKTFVLSISSAFEESKIIINSFNSDRLGLKVSLPLDVNSIDYSVRFGNNESFFSKTTKDLGEIEIDVTDISNRYGLGELIITIYNLHLNDNSNSEFIFNFYYSTSMNTLFNSGSGTNSDPYIISNYRHFNNLRYCTNYDLYYKLINDIDCSGKSNWRCISKISGELDGNGHTIIGENHNISKKDLDFNQGLFCVNCAKIKNLTLINCGISTKDNKKIEFDETLNIGMFCGINYGTIENCKYNSNETTITTIFGNSYIGGIAGKNCGIIDGCYVYISKLDSYSCAGLIAGCNDTNGRITNCMADGILVCSYFDVNQEQQNSVGGLVGLNRGDIRYSKCYGLVKFYTDALCESRILQPRMGLIIGTNYGTFVGCQSFNDVNTSGLKDVSWTEGSLWWKKTYHHNQKEYCGNMVGRNLR